MNSCGHANDSICANHPRQSSSRDASDSRRYRPLQMPEPLLTSDDLALRPGRGVRSPWLREALAAEGDPSPLPGLRGRPLVRRRHRGRRLHRAVDRPPAEGARARARGRGAGAGHLRRRPVRAQRRLRQRLVGRAGHAGRAVRRGAGAGRGARAVGIGTRDRGVVRAARRRCPLSPRRHAGRLHHARRTTTGRLAPWQ